MDIQLGHGANALKNLAAEVQQRFARFVPAAAKRPNGGAGRQDEDQDRILRQIGCELHDGPAQLIALALLKLDTHLAAPGESAAIRAVLTEALDELRAISAGLLLPDEAGKTLQGALLGTIYDHERRTGSMVSFVAGKLAVEPCVHVVSCLCRVVREALFNAFRHASGKGQAVLLRPDRDGLIVEICDRGPGMVAKASAGHGRMGIVGMRLRVESIGGTLKLERRFNGGTRLTIRVPVAMEECE